MAVRVELKVAEGQPGWKTPTKAKLALRSSSTARGDFFFFIEKLANLLG